MEDKENSDVAGPSAKKRKVSLSLKKKKPLKPSNKKLPEASRFAKPVDCIAFDQAAEGVVPVNTKNNTNWAISTFMKWACERNKICSNDFKIPEDILQSHDQEKICEVMRYFVMEVRREDGERYTSQRP